jgi:sec-independent protein translocase protein TatA
MGELSPAHLLIILVVALLVIGPAKLPETGAAIGHAMREFRHGLAGQDQAATGGSPAVASVQAATAAQTPPAGPDPVAGSQGLDPTDRS